MVMKNPETEPKTIAYDYLFNYFGGDKFKEKIITGACVQLAIWAYKEGKEVKFMEEPKPIKERYYCDIYKVSFDREKLFVMEKDLRMDNLFRIVYGWDRIEAEVVGYTLDYLDELPEEARRILPDELKDFPCSSLMEVTEDEFRDFVGRHLDDFDISDNINAQVPSIAFI